MPDNKDNITVSINIDPNSEDQLQKYTASFNSLKIAITNLNKPINNISTSINSLGKDMTGLTDVLCSWSVFSPHHTDSLTAHC